MAKCDGLFFTAPDKKHSEGYRVFDMFDPEDPEYLGWGKTWLDALSLYHQRMLDMDGECNVLIFKCRPTELKHLWGKVERIECDA